MKKVLVMQGLQGIESNQPDGPKRYAAGDQLLIPDVFFCE